MTKEQFTAALKDKGICLTDKQLEQFELYMHLLQEWNEKMNLTAIVQEEEVWEKHFYDSILPFIGLDMTKMADLGSGAGFPGIPVKIVWPQVDVTLIEPLKKRCRFLEEVKTRLNLSGLHIYDERAEDFVKTHREIFDTVSARAVARLAILAELSSPLVKVGGRFIALKGKSGREELEAADPALKTLGLQLQEIREDQLDNGQRLNLYFDKILPAPSRYPRNYGMIKKHPLEVKHG